jgi:hypothetical protein
MNTAGTVSPPQATLQPWPGGGSRASAPAAIIAANASSETA